MAKFKKVTTEQLKGIVNDGIRTSAGYHGGELQRRREEALERYLGYKDGSEIEGRNQIISTDVMDTIESMLPPLLKPFTSTSDMVRFEPVGPEDEQAADQATQYANHVFLKQNDGFQLLHETFKDALLSGVGVFKFWWDEKIDVTSETYEGLTEEELTLLMNNPDVEATEHTFDETTGLHDVKLRQEKKTGKVKVETVAPEDFLIERKARTLEEAQFVGHKIRVTQSDLIAMGYDREKVDKLSSYDEEELSTERLIREGLDDSDFGDNSTGDDTNDRSRRVIWLYECYIRTDRNGDGIAELVKILAAGSGTYDILDEEEVDALPFSVLIPIPMPHRFFGLSVADQVIPLQRIKTSLWRNLLDNVHLANNQRHEVVEGLVNMSDMMSSRPGGIVRTKQPGMIKPLTSQPVGGSILQALEYADAVKEERTGVTKYNQGLDSEALNQTATGVNLIMGMAQQRILMIARLFAEGGIRSLFAGILRLVVTHQQQEQIVRIRNEWVPMDPRNWKTQYDITINVGLGSGSEQEQAQLMQLVLSTQEKLASQMGFGQGSLVSRKNVYNALKKLTETAGAKDATAYFTPPASDGSDQPEPKPDPNQMFMESQIQIEREKLQVQLKKMETEHEHQMHELEAKTSLEREKMQINAMLEREKMASQMEQTAAKIAADAEAGATRLQVQAHIERQKAERDAVDKEIDRSDRQTNVTVNVEDSE